MNKQVRILIVEDHPLMAEATSRTLEQIASVEIVGIAHNARSCMELVALHQPDIVFLDFHLPDQYGDEIAKVVKAAHPSIHLVIFTGVPFVHMYNHLLGLGISAIISKESSGAVIQSLITLLLENHTIVPIPLFHNMKLTSGGSSPAHVLDEDETRIMGRIVQGWTNEQIAEEEHLSKRTIDNYIRKIYEKLGAKSRAQAVDKFHQLKQMLHTSQQR